MNDYIRRSAKFILYLVLIFVIVLGVVPKVGGQRPDITLEGLIHNERMIAFLLFILAYSLIYPFVAFVKIRRHLNGSFEENREKFEKAFDALQFEKISDTPDKIVYRKKSKLTRFMQWYEDSVVVIPNEDPVIISGLRKSVVRIDRIIDQLLMEKV